MHNNLDVIRAKAWIRYHIRALVKHRGDVVIVLQNMAWDGAAEVWR